MITMNLAIDLQKRGYKPAVVDADITLGTARRWGEDRVIAGLPPIPTYTGDGFLSRTLKHLRTSNDYVLLDVSVGDPAEIREGFLASNLLLVPTAAHQNDLDALEPLQRQVERAWRFNPKLSVIVVLNRVATDCVHSHVQDFKTYLRDFPNFRLAETVLPDSSVWTEARTAGKGVVETESEAGTAMQQLTSEVIAKG